MRKIQYLFVIPILLISLPTLAGDGITDPSETSYEDITVHNSSPGFFFNDEGEISAEFEWNIASGKAGDNILCARSYDDDSRQPGTLRDPFCISHDAANHALKIGPVGVGIGTFAPAVDLEVYDYNENDITAIFLTNPNTIDSNGITYTHSWGLLTLGTDGAGIDGERAWVGLYNHSNVAVPFRATTGAAHDQLALTGAGTIVRGGNLGLTNRTTYTFAPAEAVDVERTNSAARFMLTSYTDIGNEAPQYIQRRARGTSDAPQAVQANENLGIFSFRGYTGSGWTGSKGLIGVQATENWSTTSTGTKIVFYTTENGTTGISNAMEITHDGHIKVGGTQLNVPDYVFEEDYELMSLEDLHAYVMKERHLPDVPSEATIRAEGLNVTKTQMLLLQKIEELTLYTIQQQEQIETLKEELSALGK